MRIRTRIAPTPSGYLHTGNIFSFLFTRKLAEKPGDSLVLRIDDLDSIRTRREYLQDIFDSVRFAGISWDEGPRDIEEFINRFSQSLHTDRYQQLLEKLVDTGQVYACSCSRKELNELHQRGIMRCGCFNKKTSLAMPGISWRLHVPAGTNVRVNDRLMGERIIPLDNNMGDFVVRRRDGIAAYQVTSVADDLLSRINLVVRGDDLLPSTAAQLFLAKLAGLDDFLSVNFIHHPLLTDESGNKLSKSAGSTSIYTLRMEGKSREEILATINPAVERLMKQLNPD